MLKFGVGGNPDDFYNSGYKKSEDMPKYLSDFNLDSYEYECSRGVRIKEEKAKILGAEAKKHDIFLSVHAPYYISLSTTDKEKQDKSIQYILDTMRIAKVMGAKRIVVHAGSSLNLQREEAFENNCILLKRAINEARKLNLDDVRICPETMGKVNQLGNSEEIIRMCKVDDNFIPTIDFGHLYCRNLGKPKTKEEWIKELKLYIDKLGFDRMKNFHSHFSKMLYTKMGEKCHITFEKAKEEMLSGPSEIEVLKAIIELGLEPNIILESAGSQSIDAKIMKDKYLELLQI